MSSRFLISYYFLGGSGNEKGNEFTTVSIVPKTNANASATIREEAKKLFSSSPFYKPWDEKVLDVWVECGLKDKKRDGKNEGVELKMPGIQVRFPNTRKLIL